LNGLKKFSFSFLSLGMTNQQKIVVLFEEKKAPNARGCQEELKGI